MEIIGICKINVPFERAKSAKKAKLENTILIAFIKFYKKVNCNIKCDIFLKYLIINFV